MHLCGAFMFMTERITERSRPLKSISTSSVDIREENTCPDAAWFCSRNSLGWYLRPCWTAAACVRARRALLPGVAIIKLEKKRPSSRAFFTDYSIHDRILNYRSSAFSHFLWSGSLHACAS